MLTRFDFVIDKCQKFNCIILLKLHLQHTDRININGQFNAMRRLNIGKNGVKDGLQRAGCE
jgi:hypothetical protein